MQHSLSSELYWLILTLIMTALFWMPIIVNRIREQGVWGTLGIPRLDPDAAWAGRLMRAHVNAVENLLIFAVLILAIEIVDAHSSITATASMIYFFARLVHVIAYTSALPVVRTLAFVAGFFCQMSLAFTLLNVF